jgi:hypothetical protein
MTTREAFDELKRRFPGRNIKANHWFYTDRNGNAGETFFVSVDDCVSCLADSFPKAIEELRVASIAEVAAKIRREAEEKLMEASRLERQAAEIETVQMEAAS